MSTLYKRRLLFNVVMLFFGSKIKNETSHFELLKIYWMHLWKKNKNRLYWYQTLYTHTWRFSSIAPTFNYWTYIKSDPLLADTTSQNVIFMINGGFWGCKATTKTQRTFSDRTGTEHNYSPIFNYVLFWRVLNVSSYITQFDWKKILFKHCSYKDPFCHLQDCWELIHDAVGPVILSPFSWSKTKKVLQSCRCF